MPRPVWSGAISFGLVTIPIKVVTATEDHSISFRQVHTEDGGRIRYQKVCELDDRVLDQSEIGKGYEITKDTVVQVSDEELREMPLPTAKAIEIVAFVPRDRVDPVQISTSYYLQADGQVAGKPYKLLREALKRSDRVAIAKFAWHGRERLGLLRVLDEAIALHSMRWPDEIRDPAELAPAPTDVGDAEVDGALALMDAMTVARLDDLDLADRYHDALAEVITAKADHRKPAPVGGEAEPPGQVVDLMAALNASVEQARAARGDDEHATVHEMPQRPKKKAPAKKATAGKKSAATTRRRKAG
ncbi:Ku protein [Streptomyces sp. DH12]|uniref:non-homologous end joining protein Ku n=1 Tax=Streptomyces sp. DH12 TaxID=2857010 RepID=UPI001E2A8647|nr:Ku protein [Streptomyces sp. DH12]